MERTRGPSYDAAAQLNAAFAGGEDCENQGLATQDTGSLLSLSLSVVLPSPEERLVPMTIRVVSFDADNTLWDFQLVMRAALRQVLAHLRALDLKGADRLTVDQMIAIRERVFQRCTAERLRLEEIRELAFVETLRYLGLNDTSMASDLNRLYLEHRFRDIQLYDDVLPTLDVLAPRFKLGLISNGNSYPEKCGLGGRFAFVVFSQDHGIEKPDPRLFEVAFRQAHCRPSEVVHVGDSLDTDVTGAVAAGAHAVWLNRDGRNLEGHVRPQTEIRSLAELPAAIERIST